MRTEERILELIGVGVTRRVSEDILDPNYCVHRDRAHQLEDTLVIAIKGYVYGEHKDGVVISYPDGWWQAFRQRWFPAWVLKGRPVKMVTRDIKFRVIYPGFVPAIPRHGGIHYRVITLLDGGEVANG